MLGCEHSRAINALLVRARLSVLVAILISLGSGFASATSYRLDISDLAGFQLSGVGGTAGNGIVFASPVYSFLPGDTVDFGTALVRPDPPDGRAGPCPPNCFGNAAFGVYFLHNGVGGLPPGSFELFGANVGSNNLVDCAPSATCQISYALLFTLGPMINGIQLGFQGSSLAIIPPLPSVPLPAALPLFATGLGLVRLLMWRSKAQ